MVKDSASDAVKNDVTVFENVGGGVIVIVDEMVSSSVTVAVMVEEAE